MHSEFFIVPIKSVCPALRERAASILVANLHIIYNKRAPFAHKFSGNSIKKVHSAPICCEHVVHLQARTIQKDKRKAHGESYFSPPCCLQGLPVEASDKGLQIIVYSNYTTKTVLVE